jgi:hypothetical protein
VRGAGALALALTWLACPAKPLPGDLAMGQYATSATGGAIGFVSEAGSDGGMVEVSTCQLEEVTAADFDFTAVLTRDSASDRAWVTLNGYTREGTFDGQVLTSRAEASRVFAACGKCSTRVVETLSVAVLSRSQTDAVGDQCPADALDGGVVANADAGITGPGLTSQGYDAVRLCGELTTLVVADGLVDGGPCEPKCGGCTVHYQLRGERR